ncbi:MAG: RNA polymerase sigma factor [Candidatus Hydrogenedentes bacterium]|nr:RNA polymerase sigma factor [Candidatus Hydrogenedentota bacterium]
MDRGEPLAAMIREHGSYVRRFLVARGASLDDVDDLLQDVLAVAWEKQIPLSSRNTRQYLIGIARHLLFNHNRKRARHAVRADSERVRIADSTTARDVSFHSPEEFLTSRERRREAQELLGFLPSAHRQALELVYLDGLTHAEAAERLGVSRKTLHVWKRQALDTLRSLLAVRRT